MPVADALLATLALAVALALRPWRALATTGLHWPWLAWCAVMPLSWAADRLAASPIIQPLSGAVLLVWMCGWPLAVLALTAVAGVVLALSGLGALETLHRLVWLGLVPATLALGLGAAIRRWLPRHLFIYILGRGFFSTWIALSLAGAAALGWVQAPQGTSTQDLLLARFLTASGEAFLTGMLVAIFVAYRPHWLATYSDRLYLPRS